MEGVKRKKKDLMSPTLLTADRLGLSYRQGAMYAATIAQSSGVSIKDTDISVTRMKNVSVSRLWQNLLAFLWPTSFELKP